MLKRKKSNLFFLAVAFLGKIVRSPQRVFLALAVIFSLLAGAIFWDIEKIAPAPQTSAQIDKKFLFDTAAEAEYRRAFDVVKRRAANYEKAGKSLYPDIFTALAKSGVVIDADIVSPNPPEGLTEPAN